MKEYNLTLVFNNRGFTLIEILIAITLLAFITLGVVSITENAFVTKDRTTELNRNNLQVETALSRFEWDFSQIYSPLYFSTVMNLNPSTTNGTTPPNGTNPSDTLVDPSANTGVNPQVQAYFEQLVQRFERNENFGAVSQEGLPIPKFNSPDKTVFEFFTSGNRRKTENLKQSHFSWVRYSLGEQVVDETAELNPNIPKGLKALVRYFNPDDPYGDNRINIDDGNIKSAVLLENVEALEFQFWDYNRKKWETSLRTIQGGESVIRGVKLLLTWYDYSGNKRTIERIFRNHWPLVAPMDSPALQKPTKPTTTNPDGTPNTDLGVDDGR